MVQGGDGSGTRAPARSATAPQADHESELHDDDELAAVIAAQIQSYTSTAPLPVVDPRNDPRLRPSTFDDDPGSDSPDRAGSAETAGSADAADTADGLGSAGAPASGSTRRAVRADVDPAPAAPPVPTDDAPGPRRAGSAAPASPRPPVPSAADDDRPAAQPAAAPLPPRTPVAAQAQPAVDLDGNDSGATGAAPAAGRSSLDAETAAPQISDGGDRRDPPLQVDPSETAQAIPIAAARTRAPFPVDPAPAGAGVPPVDETAEQRGDERRNGQDGTAADRAGTGVGADPDTEVHDGGPTRAPGPRRSSWRFDDAAPVGSTVPTETEEAAPTGMASADVAPLGSETAETAPTDLKAVSTEPTAATQPLVIPPDAATTPPAATERIVSEPADEAPSGSSPSQTASSDLAASDLAASDVAASDVAPSGTAPTGTAPTGTTGTETATSEAASAESAPVEPPPTEPISVQLRAELAPLERVDLPGPLTDAGPLVVPAGLYEEWERTLRQIGQPDDGPSASDVDDFDDRRVDAATDADPAATDSDSARAEPSDGAVQSRDEAMQPRNETVPQLDQMVQPRDEAQQTPEAGPRSSDELPPPRDASVRALVRPDILSPGDAADPPSPQAGSDSDRPADDRIGTGLQPADPAVPKRIEQEAGSPSEPTAVAVRDDAVRRDTDRTGAVADDVDRGGRPGLLAGLLGWATVLVSAPVLLLGVLLGGTSVGEPATAAIGIAVGAILALPGSLRLANRASAAGGVVGAVRGLLGPRLGTVAAVVLIVARILAVGVLLLATDELASAFITRTGVLPSLPGGVTAVLAVLAVTTFGVIGALFRSRAATIVVGTVGFLGVVITLLLVALLTSADGIRAGGAPDAKPLAGAAAAVFAVLVLLLGGGPGAALARIAGPGSRWTALVGAVIGALVAAAAWVTVVQVATGDGIAGIPADTLAGGIVDATAAQLAVPVGIAALVAVAAGVAVLARTGGDLLAGSVRAPGSRGPAGAAVALASVAVALGLVAAGADAEDLVARFAPIVLVPLAALAGLAATAPRVEPRSTGRWAAGVGLLVAIVVGLLSVDGLVTPGERGPLLAALDVTGLPLAVGLGAAFVLGAVTGLVVVVTGRRGREPSSPRREPADTVG